MMIFAILNLDLSPLFHDEVIALFMYLLLYLTYYFSDHFEVIKSINAMVETKADTVEMAIYLRRVLGFVLLGMIPFVITGTVFDRPINDYGIGIPSGNHVWLWAVIPTIIFLIGSVLKSGKSIDLSYYPEVRVKSWNTRGKLVNAASWAVYLLGYEFAIRGMLFFSLLYAFGLWPAIIIDSVIYSLIHIFKGWKEAYGAFFLGILFCLITYYTHSIWVAYLIHVILAVTNDIKAIQAAKRMKEDQKQNT